MKAKVFAFDVYGTLVDPLQVSSVLAEQIGDKAAEFSLLWRQKQLEYSFRRGLMGAYQDFSVCTFDALNYAASALSVQLTERQKQILMESYQYLPPYEDVLPALRLLNQQSLSTVAFSNGSKNKVEQLLNHAEVASLLGQIVSVDSVSSFKPDPKVYDYLCETVSQSKEHVCLVSSNPFDVIGAKNRGLTVVWVKRSSSQVFDPWGVEPDLVVADLMELVSQLSD